MMNLLMRCTKFLFSRLFIFGALIVLQLAFFAYLLLYLNTYFVYVQGITYFLAIILIIYIVNRPGSASTKIPWIILILTFPLLGVAFYFFCGNNHVHIRFNRSLQQSLKQTASLHIQNESVVEKLQQESPLRYREAEYIFHSTMMALHDHTQAVYFRIGEDVFSDLMDHLRAARHFIFMEFFIVHEGYMWNSILNVLKEKVQEGVEVRFLYDDIGCLMTLPDQYDKELESYGIQCSVFNPFGPILTVGYNNRDHRKICVIDGYIGYTGGFNLADEYINRKIRFGHWKDSAVRLEGEGVWNLTLAFLENWDFTRKTKTDFSLYGPHVYHPTPFAYEEAGYVQPFGDNPMDHELVGESVYMNLLHHANRYVYITTPYLVIDHELMTALTLCAKSGTDVRIITPHIPDKWYVHMMTRSYYEELLQAGVRIYEYTPGFIHAKNFVSDDEVAVCGTINLDYRSLYHHFECGCWMYQTASVMQMKEDFLWTLTVCEEVTLKACHASAWYVRLARSIIRIFAPLL